MSRKPRHPHRPRLVAFDLDDTLAPSKSPLPAPMAAALEELLDEVPVLVISGGRMRQFRTQVLENLTGATGAQLAQLHLMPTCGTRYYRYEEGAPAPASGDRDVPRDWREVYTHDLSAHQRDATLTTLEAQAKELGLWAPDTGEQEDPAWGPILEDRGSQVTFSALGQAAPVAAKKAWDPTGAKKSALRDAVAPLLPDLEVRSGGSTSVDVTLRGVDKAYGMTELAAQTGIGLDEMLFVGDRLDPAGNDYPVKALGVPCVAVTGWEETLELARELTAHLRAH